MKNAAPKWSGGLTKASYLHIINTGRLGILKELAPGRFKTRL